MALLYGIAGDLVTLRELLASKIPLVQYRTKEVSTPLPLLSTSDRKRIIINDDLFGAENAGVLGVHLGQEDLGRYDRSRLLGRKVRLGISTHSFDEISIALQYSPDYLAFGPVFETTSKAVAYAPQGVSRLREVVESSPLPIFAIGGITLSNYEEVLSTGVAGVAVIGALQGLSLERKNEWALQCRLAVASGVEFVS